MSVETWAGLGSHRGAGESLASWLRAGPLGARACPAPGARGRRADSLFCPACWVDEAGRRRWYSREAWSNNSVVCTVHGLPLLYCDTVPKRVRGRRWSQSLREEFDALAKWAPQDHLRAESEAITRAICARSDPREAYSAAWSEAQWYLWAEGWPVAAAPKMRLHGVLHPIVQSDRLALTAIVRRIVVNLETGRHTGWPALPVRPRVLIWLQARIQRLQIDCRMGVAGCFRDAMSKRG